jgi:hypothetical protein
MRLPCLGKPVSSTIDASMAPNTSILGKTVRRTLASTAWSDHGALATKCSSDSCFAAVRAGAVSRHWLDALALVRQQQPGATMLSQTAPSNADREELGGP